MTSKNAFTVKELKKALAHNEKRALDIKVEDAIRLKALEARLRKASEPRLAALAKEREVLKSQLAKHNPFPVGTRIQKVINDGLLGGALWEVTRVVDHDRFYARFVISNGKLSQTTELFHQKAYKYRPQDYKTVPPVKEAATKARKAAVAAASAAAKKARRAD